MSDAAELGALGLYDPTAPDAAERLSLVRLAREHGATLDEIRTAIAGNRLHALAAERVMLDDSPHRTLADVAAAAGLPLDLATQLWRALGFAVPADDDPVCTDHDVALLRFYGELAAGVGVDATVGQARTTGAAMARVADSAIQMVRAGVEAPLRQAGASDLAIAGQFVELASVTVPRIYPMFEAVHRHHLVDAARRYSLWGAPATAASTTDAVVGFADLVGYSTLNEQLTTAELDQLIATFEQEVMDAVARPGARLVKVIGDEAMFAAGHPTDAVAVARALLAAPALPPLRIGMATGTVLAREGDLYGPVVNLAARLERLAEPGEVLVDAETARGLDAATVRACGPRTVAGFAAPVDVYALSP